MPRHRYQLPIRLFTIPREGSAKPEPDAKRRIVEGASADAVLTAARRLMEDEGRVIRSMSMGLGEVVVVCYPPTPKNTRAMRESARRYPKR